MKKIISSRIFIFIVTALVFTGIGVLADDLISASKVNYNDTTVDLVLDDLYSKLSSYDPLNSNTVELIGRNLGSTVTVPAGYKYVIVFNGYYGANGYRGDRYKEVSLLNSNTNSTVVINDWSVGADSYATAAGWLILAKVTDTTQESTLTFAASGFNVVYGLK